MWTTKQTVKHIVYNSVMGAIRPPFTYQNIMRNKLNYIKNSWTFNHKMLIIALSLALAHILPLIQLPILHAEVIEYTKPPQTDNSLQSQIEKRAIELHEENKAIDLEKYRHEAIKEKNLELQDMVNNSPFVDYKELKDKYGY